MRLLKPQNPATLLVLVMILASCLAWAQDLDDNKLIFSHSVTGLNGAIKIDVVGDDLKFFDDSNPGGFTLTELESSEGAHDHVTADVTDHGDFVFDAADWATEFAAEDTDGLSEGPGNLYFTNARAVSAVAGTFLPLDGSATMTGNFLNSFGGSSSFSGAGAQLGIGTNSPVEALHILSELASGNAIHIADSTNVQDWQIGVNASGQLRARYNDTTNFITITSAGNFTIGSNSTSGLLDFMTTTLGVGGAGTDYILKFDGQDSDGILKWLEDEAAWHFDNTGGIGIAPTDGTFHVHTATAGAVTASTAVDDLVVENSGNGGISILVPDASLSSLYFGSPTDNVGAKLEWSHSTKQFIIGSSATSGTTIITAGDNQTAISINSSREATFLQNLTIGQGSAGVDYTQAFDGETNDGVMTWLEDEAAWHFDNTMGVGIAPTDGTLHVHTASAGAITASTNADELVVENSGPGGISILTPAANSSSLYFGSPDDSTGVILTWQDSALAFSMGTAIANGEVSIKAGNNIEAMHITTADVLQGSGAAGVDYTRTIDGETNDLVQTWMEDEAYLNHDKGLLIGEVFGATPDTVAIIAIGNSFLTASTSHIKFTSNATYTLNSTPTITDGTVDGQILILRTLDTVDSITIQDEANLAGSNFVNAGTDLTISADTNGTGKPHILIWDATASVWILSN